MDAELSFKATAKNKIHRFNFEDNKGIIGKLGDLGPLLYPGSLSTEEQEESEWDTSKMLEELVDIDNKQVSHIAFSIIFISKKHFSYMIPI